MTIDYQKMSAEEQFQKWAVNPIKKLRELDSGDGGFAAMTLAFALYERHVIAKVPKRPKDDQYIGGGIVEEYLHRELNAYPDPTDITKDDVNRFRLIFRNGLAHTAFPGAKGKGNWMFTEDTDRIVKVELWRGVDTLVVDPWRFTEFVFHVWRGHLEDFGNGGPSVFLARDSE